MVVHVYNNNRQNIIKKYTCGMMWGLRGKARKCPIGTVLCLSKEKQCWKVNYDSDEENSGAKQFGGLLVIVTFVMYACGHF